MKHISKKKICKTITARDSKKRPRLDKLIVELDRWVRKNLERIEKEKLKQIEWCIERQYQMIDEEQGRMIKKGFNREALEEKWAQVYAPLERVQEKWFEALDKNISKEERKGMLKDLKRNTALGVSGIMYTIIKAANNEI
ncbi:5628_t:CDS:2 [Gigaspora margarita]|uniref:5628_t:CDS:1 n=1 Tax=Gigaspora margarita TaxID=4874 RepID=A0ABN7USQ3_GIGMA|nr:5628_t:CDS:2 [Gigaspora margarita]